MELIAQAGEGCARNLRDGVMVYAVQDGDPIDDDTPVVLSLHRIRDQVLVVVSRGSGDRVQIRHLD